jgi:2-methylcitrate dehydratase PrpD
LTGQTASPAAAVFHNALLAARLDLDDGHRQARGHPGAAVIPAVLAAADLLAVSDSDVLRAVIVGYEVGLRVAAARGFYARTGFWAGVAAAAGVAALRRVPPPIAAHAYAIALETGPHMATTTAGPAWPQPNGSDVKEGIAWGVVHGLAAVDLAQAGMTGPLDIADHAPFFDRAAILGDRPRALIHETYIKFYAACRHCHAPVDAVLSVVTTQGLALTEIDAITVHAYSGALRISNRTEPKTLADAQYSIPYCIGLALTRGPAALLPMTEQDLGDATAEALARRVTLTIDPACEARFPAETPVWVTLSARGQTLHSAVTVPRGEASAPPGWDERIDKVRIAARSVNDLDSWVAALTRLRAGSLGPIRALLSAARRSETGR